MVSQRHITYLIRSCSLLWFFSFDYTFRLRCLSVSSVSLLLRKEREKSKKSKKARTLERGSLALFISCLSNSFAYTRYLCVTSNSLTLCFVRMDFKHQLSVPRKWNTMTCIVYRNASLEIMRSLVSESTALYSFYATSNLPSNTTQLRKHIVHSSLSKMYILINRLSINQRFLSIHLLTENTFPSKHNNSMTFSYPHSSPSQHSPSLPVHSQPGPQFPIYNRAHLAFRATPLEVATSRR